MDHSYKLPNKSTGLAPYFREQNEFAYSVRLQMQSNGLSELQAQIEESVNAKFDGFSQVVKGEI